jgi:hypothetical protein
MKRIGIGALLAAALVAAAPARAGQRPRPADASPGPIVSEIVPNGIQIYNDYATAELTYASRHAVVHWVALGIDAPPLNDDDANGVPDYVERVAVAADAAIDYFESWGYAAIRPDEGGPDARPDIYVSRFTPGYFGIAFPAVQARGGAFVVVSNGLDPSPERSLGSLYGTVVHELFHLVQFSYFPRTAEPAIPDWVLEGSAMAMETRVYPQLDDLVAALQLRSWFDRPQASLTTQSYGSQLLWRYLDEREPRLLPRYLHWIAHRPAGVGAAAGLATTWAHVSRSPFAAAFGQFAAWVAGEYAGRIRPLGTLAVGRRTAGSVPPLAIHFLRLPHPVHTVRFRATAGRPSVALVYEHESLYAGRAAVTRHLTGRQVGRALVFTIPPSLRQSPRFGPATLVVANGDPARPSAYSVAVARGDGQPNAGERSRS